MPLEAFEFTIGAFIGAAVRGVNSVDSVPEKMVLVPSKASIGV